MRGEAIDSRSDLYAVGIVLCEMLTGRRPFEAEEVTELWQAHLSAPIPTLAELGFVLQGGSAENLDAIVTTLLAKQPNERFANAHAAKRALDSLGW